MEGSINQKRLELIKAFEREVTGQHLQFFPWGFAQFEVHNEGLIVTKLASFQWLDGQGVSLSGCKEILADLCRVATEFGCKDLIAVVGNHPKASDVIELYLNLGFKVVKIVNDNVLLTFKVR